MCRDYNTTNNYYRRSAAAPQARSVAPAQREVAKKEETRLPSHDGAVSGVITSSATAHTAPETQLDGQLRAGMQNGVVLRAAVKVEPSAEVHTGASAVVGTTTKLVDACDIDQFMQCEGNNSVSARFGVIETGELVLPFAIRTTPGITTTLDTAIRTRVGKPTLEIVDGSPK